jgi:hypothetical protein
MDRNVGDQPAAQIKRIRLNIVEGDKNQLAFGSDVRKQDVIKPCALCLKERRLLLSHISPKWSYFWMKEEGYVLHARASRGYWLAETMVTSIIFSVAIASSS